MSQVVLCPHCQGHVVNEPRLGGQVVSCPHCQGQFTMPAIVSVVAKNLSPSSEPAFPIIKRSSSAGIYGSRYRQQWRVSPESEITKLWLGVVGSVVLFIGVFSPVISVPIIGNVNLFQNGSGIGIVVLALAGVSFVLTLMRVFSGLWFTGLASLAIMGITFFNLQIGISEAKYKMDAELQGNPFRGLADVAMLATQFQWGWAVLVVGAGLVVASAAIPNEQQRSRLRGR